MVKAGSISNRFCAVGRIDKRVPDTTRELAHMGGALGAGSAMDLTEASRLAVFEAA
jgi:hypothetical protein